MIRIRSRRRSETRLIADLDDILRPGRTHVLGVLWRWPYELGLVTGFVAVVTTLARTVGTAWAVVTADVIRRGQGPWPCAA